ncbi:MAG: NlpC/P60 family peptidoglycan endopeptidase RipA, partial [Mycobacterium sp.]
MRRTSSASASRLCTRVCVIPLTAGMLLITPGLGGAQPAGSDSIGTLVAAVANVNQKLQDLGAAIQAKQEGVNKAIVDVQTARDNAEAAQHDVDASRLAVDDSNAA